MIVKKKKKKKKSKLSKKIRDGVDSRVKILIEAPGSFF